MRIAIDIDEVLAETLEAFLDYHNKKYKTSFCKEQFYTYDWWEIMNISVKKILDRFYDFIKTDHGSNIVPVEGAVETIKYLSKNNKLSLITGRPKKIFKETHDWINRYFPKCIEEIHFTGDYVNPIKNITKGNICKQINASFIIEDVPRYSENCAQAGVDVFLFDRPWNQGVEQNDKIRRVYSWKDIASKLDNNTF